MLRRFWQAEPLIASLLGSAAVWGALFALLAAFNHPLTPTQQGAITGLIAAIGTIIGRSQVTPIN